MAELKAKVKGVSRFLELTKNLGKNVALATFAGNSSAMRAGITAKVIDVDFYEVPKTAAPPITQDQVATIGGELITLVEFDAENDKQPQAVTIMFDNGMSMTLGLLYQGGEKTRITFKGDAKSTSVLDLQLGDIADKLIDKTFKCVKYTRDNSNPIGRNIGSEVKKGPGRERSYPANVYEFVEQDEA